MYGGAIGGGGVAHARIGGASSSAATDAASPMKVSTSCPVSAFQRSRRYLALFGWM